MKKVQKGFTLIELMIVIAIIGILAAIAIPQYQDYVTRSKVTEGLSLVQSVETAIAETYQTNGSMPAACAAGDACNASFGLPKIASISGKYVTSVGVTSGTGIASTYATITYNGSVGGGVASGDILVLTAITAAGGVSWVCGNKSVTINGTAYNAGATTTVPNKFLPANCR